MRRNKGLNRQEAMSRRRRRVALVPELLGVGLLPVQLHARGLRTTDRTRGGDQEMDFVLGETTGAVHIRMIESVNTLTN
jgi:hypothetical protein